MLFVVGVNATINNVGGTDIEDNTIILQDAKLKVHTLADLQAMTPADDGNGYIYYCSDCAATKICVSTGTAVGSYASASGAACK